MLRSESKKRISRQPADNDQCSISDLNKSLIKTGNIIGIGSPRATIESNFALMTLVGKDNFYHGISRKEYQSDQGCFRIIFRKVVFILLHLKEIEKADVVLVIGEDLVNTAPMIALAVRQAARNVPNEEAKKNHIPLWNDIPVRQLGQNHK